MLKIKLINETRICKINLMNIMNIISFNSDLNKLALEIIFSRMTVLYHIVLGIYLNEKLNFYHHWWEMLKSVQGLESSVCFVTYKIYKIRKSLSSFKLRRGILPLLMKCRILTWKLLVISRFVNELLENLRFAKYLISVTAPSIMHLHY